MEGEAANSRPTGEDSITSPKIPRVCSYIMDQDSTIDHAVVIRLTSSMKLRDVEDELVGDRFALIYVITLQSMISFQAAESALQSPGPSPTRFLYGFSMVKCIYPPVLPCPSLLLDRLLNLLVLLVLLRLALLALGLDLILEGMALEMEGILSEVVKQSPVFFLLHRRI
jgi:hypothetical protein